MGILYFRLTRVFMALLLLRDVADSSADDKPCSFCLGGEDVALLLDKELNLTWPVSASNCTMLDAYANSLLAGSASCANVQSITTICGCPRSIKACNLCPDGSNVTLRDKKLSFLAASFDGALLSCEQFDAYLHSIDASSDKCKEAQVTGSVCGCPVAAHDGCEVCRGENMTTPNKTLPQLDLEYTEWSFNPPTCELAEAAAYDEFRAGTIDCLYYQDWGYLCGCIGFNDETTSHRQTLLAWLTRVSSVLSIFGSSFIIYDVVKNKRFQETLQSQLLLAMSCVDCLSSTAWSLSTIPIPETYPNGDSTNIYGARGNEATCTAQTFFIQLGLAVPFCNLALAVYYMLIIIYGWREHQIKKHRFWIIGLPLLVGLGLACAVLPFSGVWDTMCYLDNYSFYFMTLPISIVIFFATTIMFMIYWKVYHQERRVRRWIVGSNVQSLPRKVFWQGFWYLMCFYVSWPIVLVFFNIDKGSLYDHFGFYCTAMFVMPLQGFLNFITYTRRRIPRCMKHYNMRTATTVTATSATPTRVTHQDELMNRSSAKNSVTASEPASGTVQAEKQTVDSCTVDCPLGDANEHIAQKGNKPNIEEAPEPSILILADG